MSEIFKTGREDASILVVTDWTMPDAKLCGQHLQDRHAGMFAAALRREGFSMQDCVFINPCPIKRDWIGKKPPTEKQHAEWVAQYADEFAELFYPLTAKARAVLVLGKSAARQVFGKPVKVTKERGAFKTAPGVPCPVLVTLSPAHVQSRPEAAEDFATDIRMLGSLRDSNWRVDSSARALGEYELTTDLSEWLRHPPAAVCVDTETTSLEWARDATVLTVQLCREPGHALVIPVSGAMFPEFSRRERMNAVRQLASLLSNPRVRVFGHNLKFDLHILGLLGVSVKNWWLDTLQLVFALDENLRSKSLKESVRRWVPEMAGYSDEFDAKTDKSNMIACDPAELVRYGGGDADATYRLCEVLLREVKRDHQQWLTVKHIQMPALRMFFRMERAGMKVNADRLEELSSFVASSSSELESKLLAQVPIRVRQKHAEAGLSLGRRALLADTLFSQDGFGLEPTEFVSDGTPALDSQHLLGFSSNKFVAGYLELQRIKKMESTYVGNNGFTEPVPVKLLKSGGWPASVKRLTNREPEEMQTIASLGKHGGYDLLTPWEGGKCLGRRNGEFVILTESKPTGFWKYIMPDGRIHPTFHLDRTVTGRSSSSDPNFQNIPKRGDQAKPFRRVLTASGPSRVLIECDLSQAELRYAAIESGDRTMLDAYRNGIDLHALTASKVAGVPLDKVTKDMRQKAKAVNFGFLYTMGADSFVIYARTQYGVIFTPREGKAVRDIFFDTYPGLVEWHKRRRAEVREHGYVRGLLGAVRHLPAIHSTDPGVQAESERQAINSPIQRIASDSTLMSMVLFSKNCPKSITPLGTIHDSGVVECDEQDSLMVGSWIKWCFIHPPFEELFGVTLPIPLGADVSIGPDLGSMEEVPTLRAVKPPWID